MKFIHQLIFHEYKKEFVTLFTKKVKCFLNQIESNVTRSDLMQYFLMFE